MRARPMPVQNREPFSRRRQPIGRSPIVTPDHKFKNIHSVAFGIGDLFVFALYTTVDGAEREPDSIGDRREDFPHR